MEPIPGHVTAPGTDPARRPVGGRWAERTMADLRAAVADGRVAKTDLQLYGLDWSQIEDEPDSAVLQDVFARHGAVLETADLEDATGGMGRALS